MRKIVKKLAGWLGLLEVDIPDTALMVVQAAADNNGLLQVEQKYFVKDADWDLNTITTKFAEDKIPGEYLIHPFSMDGDTYYDTSGLYVSRALYDQILEEVERDPSEQERSSALLLLGAGKALLKVSVPSLDKSLVFDLEDVRELPFAAKLLDTGVFCFSVDDEGETEALLLDVTPATALLGKAFEILDSWTKIKI